MLLLVMGVTGCGKTTLGQRLAAHYGIPFYDADDFHPSANRAKLLRDEPLNDTDRAPWLALLADHIHQWQAAGDCVLACSALKQRYRAVLLAAAPHAEIIHIVSDAAQIAYRLEARRTTHELVKNYHHILAAQYADLEPPGGAIELSGALAPDAMLNQAVQALALRQYAGPCR